MKAIFISQSPDSIYRVFTRDAVQELVFGAGLYPEIFGRKDVLEDPGKFSGVKYIFSTWGMPAFSKEEIASFFPSLEAVFYAAGSVKYFAAPFLESGIRIFSAADANTIPVAEYAVSQIILANKGFFLSSRLMRDKGWSEAHRHFCAFPGNNGAHVGILGAGRIGNLVAKTLLEKTDLKVMVYDAFMPPAKITAMGAEPASLEKIFATCQTISNHLADNEKTRGMLGYGLFSLMKENAVFINTGRGAQILEDDLSRALGEKPERTAVLDVATVEPVPQDHPFRSLPNVFLTPHIAGSSGMETRRLGDFALNAFRSYLSAGASPAEVFLSDLDKMA